MSNEILQYVLVIPLPVIISLLLVNVTNTVLNGAIAYSIKKLRKERIISYWLIYCLCISDTLIGITGCMSQLFLILYRNELNNVTLYLIFQITSFAFTFTTRVSAYMTVVIGIDRFIRMQYMLQYNTAMTKNKARIAVALCCLFSAFSVICLSSTRFHQLMPDNVVRVCLYIRSIIHFLCLIVFPVSYILAYRIVKRRVHAGFYETNGKLCIVKVDKEGNNSYNLRNNNVGNASKITKDNEHNSATYRNDQVAIPAGTMIKPRLQAGPDVNPGGEDGQNTDQTEGKRVTKKSNDETTRLPVSSLKPENEILKYACLALFAIIICYVPFLTLEIHTLVSEIPNYQMESIFLIFVCLNSTINGIILLYFSKGLRAPIKCLF